MIRRLLVSTILIAAISLAAPVLTSAASAQVASKPSAPSVPAKPKKVLKYLMVSDIDPKRLLPPPPVDGSAMALADLAELHRIVAARTPERFAQAQWDDDHEDASAFNATVTAGFDVAKLPMTAELLEDVNVDAGLAAAAAKSLFARKRPWAVDPTIPTCDPNDAPLTSYPRGHSTRGYAIAMTYALLIPEKAQAFMSRGADYAYSRQVCGSHYPSDTVASQALAASLVATLNKNPEFQAKLEAARTELRSGHYTGQ
jgi:acid phosphatase (class A)